MCKLLFALVAACVLPVALGGSYDAQKYYYLVQYADTQCATPTAITMMALDKCYTQTVGPQATVDPFGYSSTGYAKASITQTPTGTSTTGTLTLQSYTDSSCTQTSGSAIPITLPMASSTNGVGPYGMSTTCASSLPGTTGLGNVYNTAGIYSFTNKLELEAVMSQVTATSGPVYATFADNYCTTENLNDPSGNQLPIYAHWSSNSACTYSFLTTKFKKETCSYGNSAGNNYAYQNTWQGYSDNACTQAIGSPSTYGETDATYCASSSDPAFPYYQNAIVGPFTGGYCAAGGYTNQYVVLEQYYQDSQCANGPTAVNAVLLGQCVQDTNGYFKAFFVPGDSTFMSNQNDKAGILTIQAYSDAGCNNVVSGNAMTFSIPTAAKGFPATSCNPGPSNYNGFNLGQYYFKGGIYNFDDYSKMQATVTNNFGAGTILTTYGDLNCQYINGNNALGGGLPIMLTYMSNNAGCVLNVATMKSLKTTCTGTADASGVTTDTGSASVYGQLTGTVTLYSDTSCATPVSGYSTPVTYTTPNQCYSSSGTGSSNILATLGSYTSGFCQLTNEKSYNIAPGTINSNDEADECTDTISGVLDSPKTRAAYVAAQLTAYPAGTTLTVLGVTSTGSTSRRLGAGVATPIDHRGLSVAGLRFRTIVRNPASTAAALKTAFQSAGSAIQTAMTRRLGASIQRTAGAIRTLATRIRNALTPTNLPGSTGSTTSSCFAAGELVTLENGATKAIADVEVGDRVLTVNANGEQVFSAVAYLPHGKNEASSTFVTVATASGRDVKMTANHILPAGACAAQTLPMVSADQVVVGNCVETVSGREQVVSVGKIEGKGIYTVIAMEELIVVNGIVATPYGGVNPTVANIYYNLHRLMYAYAPSVMSKNWVQTATEMLWGDLSTLNA